MTSVDKVVSAIRSALLSGAYSLGAPLPSARDLSRQLRVNKNTVSKAFGLLTREGLVEVGRGRRATAVGSPAQPEVADEILRRRLREALTPVLREARFLGIGQERIAQTIHDEIGAFYRAMSPRVRLVECNRIDAQQYAKELAALLATPVEWQLLDELKREAADVFVVPYYHLDDVAGRLSGARVAGIQVAPDPEVLLELLESLQAAGSPVALICGNQASAQRFARLFEFYTTKAIPIAHYRDRRATAALLRSATKVFATAEALSAIQGQAGRKKLILFRERIDANSLGPLRLLVRDLDGHTGTHSGAGAGRRRKLSGAAAVAR